MSRRTVIFVLFAISLIAAAAKYAVVAGRPITRDEAATLIRSAGLTNPEFTGKLNGGTYQTNNALKQELLESVSPPSRILRAWFIDSPHGSLLQYLLISIAKLTGLHSVSSFRDIGVIWTMLLGGAVYCLSVQIFRSPAGALVAAALVSFSPHFTIEVRELRQYPFFTLAAITTTCLFLEALSRDDRRFWVAYAAGLVLAMYSAPLGLLLIPIHSISYFHRSVRGERRSLGRYTAATAAAFLLYLPAFFACFRARNIVGERVSWLLREEASLRTRILELLSESRILFEGFTVREDGFAVDLPAEMLFFGLLAFGAAVWSFTNGAKHCCAIVLWLFVFVPFFLFGIFDVLFNTFLAATPRFLILPISGMTILIGSCIGSLLDHHRASFRVLGAITAVAAFAIELAHTAQLYSAPSWAKTAQSDDLGVPASKLDAAAREGESAEILLNNNGTGWRTSFAITSIALSVPSNIPIKVSPTFDLGQRTGWYFSAGYGEGLPAACVREWLWETPDVPGADGPGGNVSLIHCGARGAL